MENYGKVSLQPHKDPKVLLKLALSGKLLQSERNGMDDEVGGVVAEKQRIGVNSSSCSW